MTFGRCRMVALFVKYGVDEWINMNYNVIYGEDERWLISRIL